MKQSLAIAGVLALFAACSAAPIRDGASIEDAFLGSYESETRENFGTDTYGEYKIDITSPGPGRYWAKLLRGSRLLVDREVFPCDVSEEPYLGFRPGGDAKVLCVAHLDPFLSYAESGLNVPAVDIDLAKVISGAASMPERPTYKLVHRNAKYYARVNYAWAIYGFRKVRN